MEAEGKELASQVQQAQDEKSELETGKSALQKKFIQQVEKYDHDIEVITQVCSRSARVQDSFVHFVYSCTDSLPLPNYLSLYLVLIQLPMGW